MIASRKVIIAFIILLSLLSGCGKKGRWWTKETNPAVLYEKGLELFKKKRYEKALEVFNELKGSFPGVDPYYTWAELKAADIPYVIFQIGLSHCKQIRSIDRDQSSTRKALSNFEFLIANYPPSIFTEKAREKAKMCREKLAGKELYIAKYHYKRKKYQGAKARLEALGKSHLKLGEWEAARSVFTNLVQNHPDSNFLDRGKKALSELAEQGFESGEK